LELSRYYDLAVKFAGISEKLSVAIRNRAIYFDQTSYESVAKYGAELTTLGIKYYAETFENLDMAVEPDQELIAQKIRTARRELYEAAKGNVDDLRQTLITEFRLLMKAER
jgi:hypothetical protein